MPSRAFVLTVSDTCARGARVDESGEVLGKLLEKDGFVVLGKEIVSDNKSKIKQKLKKFSDYFKVDLILTTGGTGLGPRDMTPEATRGVVEKEIPGLTELMRFKNFKRTQRAALSCATAGVRGKTLVINLPGSPRGAQESYQAIAGIIPHALAMIRGEGH